MAKLKKASLSVRDGRLHLQGTGAPLPPRLHVLLTNLLGYEYNEELRLYSRDQATASAEELRDLVDLSAEVGVEISLDAETERVISHWSSQNEEQSHSRNLGLRLKKQSHATAVKIKLKRELKPYQHPAVEHMLAVSNAANFSVPGAGKTAVVLTAYAILRSQNLIDSLVVVGPRASFVSWEEEAAATLLVAPIVTRVTGSRERREEIYSNSEKADIFLTTYQSAANDATPLRSMLMSRRTMLVLDESHYAKRLEGGRWATALLDLAPYAERRVILSGTPVPNGLEDLWSQMTFLWPQPPLLGTRDQYRQALADHPDDAAEYVRDIASPFFWRTRKADLGLPSPKFRRVQVPMGKYQSAIYGALAAKVLADVVRSPTEREKLRQWRRARMTRLLQAATNPSLLTEFSEEFQIPPLDAAGLSIETLVERYSTFEVPSKISFTIELVKSLIKKKRKVLVWTSFVHNIRTLERQLSTFRPRVVYGDIPKDAREDEIVNREKMISEFKTDDEFPLLIANPAACAESVSLHKVCKDAIYLDRTFNGAHYMQSLDRIHRIGLGPRDHVNYWIPLAQNTVDLTIDRRLEEKQERLTRILDHGFEQVSLELPQDVFSEQEDEEEDFAAVVRDIASRLAKSASS